MTTSVKTEFLPKQSYQLDCFLDVLLKAKTKIVDGTFKLFNKIKKQINKNVK